MWLTVILIIFTSFLGVIYLWFKTNFSYWRRRHPQIPSVKGRIFSGNFKDFITFKTNFAFHLKTLYEDELFQNATVVGVYDLYKPALLIREPELLKSIFIKDFDLFRNRACQAGNYDPLGSLNIFFARYPEWKESRSKLVHVFSSGKLKNMYPLIQKVGVNLEDFLRAQQSDCFTEELVELCGRYVIDVLSTTILGTSCNSLKNPKEIMYTESTKLLEFNLKRAFDFLIIFFAPKLNPLLRPKVFYKSTEKFMRSSIKEMMAERERTGIMRNDLIDAFLKIKQEAEMKTDLDLSYCMEGIISQGCILVTAAFDASSRPLALTMLELAKDEEVQQKLRHEILEALLKSENGELSYESLNKMEYLEMVIDEVLRLYPGLPMIERKHELHANRSTAFNLKPYYDYELPNEMPIYVSVTAIHHDAKYWPNPTKFEPERFRPAKKKLMPPMTYMPFGVGPHMCIGSRLGILMIKVALVNFLKNHYVRVCATTVTEPIFEGKSVILQPKGGLYVEFIRDNLYLEKVVSAKNEIKIK